MEGTMKRIVLLASVFLLQMAGLAWAARWVPPPGTTFEWILQNYAGTIPAAKAIDVDLFDTPASQVATLKTNGKRVICYVSVGSWENWRPDKNLFPASVIGRPLDGWPGERWLDIRKIGLLGPVLGARLDRCKAKGFNAVEPDNLDGFQANTGFPITRADEVRFIKWLAAQAHQKGLSIGLKNVPELVPDVVGNFDWALTEDCFDQGWCGKLRPFITAGKAVFAVEYTDTGIDFAAFCARAKQLKLSPLLKSRSLTSWSRRCP
jgi:endo-alpha-1,4-polygalactosaminidase (GH114 family)